MFCFGSYFHLNDWSFRLTAYTLFGNGVCKYIVSPITSGEPSWPRSTPVDMVHATCSLLDVAGVDLLEIAVTMVGVVAGLRGPVGRLGHERLERLSRLGERCAAQTHRRGGRRTD